MKRTVISIAIAATMSTVLATEYPTEIADTVATVESRITCVSNGAGGCYPTRMHMYTYGTSTKVCWQYKHPSGVWAQHWNACDTVPDFRCEIDGYEWISNENEGSECQVHEPYIPEPDIPEDESKRVCISRQLPQSEDVEFIDGSNYVVIRKSMDGENVEVSEIEEQTDFDERCHVFKKKETAEEEQYWSVATYEIILGPETTSHDWIINAWVRGETYYPFTKGQATQFQDQVYPGGYEGQRIPTESVDSFETDQRGAETYYRFDVPAWGGGDTKIVIGTGMVWGTDL